MRAIVTGATGLVGRHLVNELCDLGWSVLAIVRDSAHRHSLTRPSIDLQCCDLSRDRLDPEAFRKVDTVFHTAAAVTDWAPWTYFQANTVEATRCIAQAMVATGCKRLVHFSTVGVYGRPRTTEPIREDCRQQAVSRWDYYPISKIQAEEIVWQFHRQNLLDVTVIRPAMIYGPGDRTFLAKLIPLLRQRKIVLFGDETMTLPLVHARDVASAAIRVATSDRTKGESFNVVNEEKVTQSEFFNAASSIIGSPPVQRRVPYRLAYTVGFLAEIYAHACNLEAAPRITRYRVGLMGHKRHYSTDKIRATVGWQPQVSFQKGIREAIQWHLDQERHRLSEPPQT